jgi:hypothetical protein
MCSAKFDAPHRRRPTEQLCVDDECVTREVRKDANREALRLSMRELIEKGAPYDAHPAQWAPFVLVGEGKSSAKRTGERERSAVGRGRLAHSA